MHEIIGADHTQYSNIRAEVFLIELLESIGKLDELSEVAISPEGSFNRTYKPDVLSIAEEVNEFGLKKTTIRTSRAGLYDSLPSSFFHPPEARLDNSDKKRSKEEIARLLNKRKKEEKEARKFFRPFDQAFNWYRILTEMEERKAVVGFSNNLQCRLFELIWGNYNDEITHYQKTILFHLAPLAYCIVGNIRLTELCFEAMLNTKVEIKERYRQGIQSEEDKTSILNNCYLGADSILGIHSEELELTYLLKISTNSNAQTMHFLPGASGRKALKILTDFFIPLNVNLEYQIVAETSLIEFEPPDKGEINDAKNRLGYTVTL